MTPPSRPRPVREAPELEAMVRRMLRSLVRRATEGDLFSLEALANIRRAATTAERDAARGAHDGPAAYSWTEVAAELGISRQAARQLYGQTGAPDAD